MIFPIVIFLNVLNSFVYCADVTLLGAGASFPAEVYSSWSLFFAALRASFLDVNIVYESVGSGAGKERILQVIHTPVRTLFIR